MKSTTSRDNEIHSYTHTMEEKWIFLLIINKDTSDKSCQHLVRIERPSTPLEHPPLQSSISVDSSQDNGNIGKSINGCSKGQRDADRSMYECGTNPL